MNIEQTLNAKPLSDRGIKILMAAQKLFLEHGYDKTSLEMIINESGGSRRNIYSEFGNKEGLLVAVMREQAKAQVGTLLDINYALPPQQALSEVCEKFLRGMLSETLVGLFRLVSNIVPKIPEVGEMIYHYGPLTGCKPIGDYLAFLQKEGVLQVDDFEFASKLLIEMIKGRLHLRAILVPKESITDAEIKEHVDKTVSLFLKAYAK